MHCRPPPLPSTCETEHTAHGSACCEPPHPRCPSGPPQGGHRVGACRPWAVFGLDLCPRHPGAFSPSINWPWGPPGEADLRAEEGATRWPAPNVSGPGSRPPGGAGPRPPAGGSASPVCTPRATWADWRGQVALRASHEVAPPASPACSPPGGSLRAGRTRSLLRPTSVCVCVCVAARCVRRCLSPSL